ncbi:hypothetical protein ACOMHN_039445 [Nucella lapillus]
MPYTANTGNSTTGPHELCQSPPHKAHAMKPDHRSLSFLHYTESTDLATSRVQAELPDLKMEQPNTSRAKL